MRQEEGEETALTRTPTCAGEHTPLGSNGQEEMRWSVWLQDRHAFDLSRPCFTAGMVLARSSSLLEEETADTAGVLSRAGSEGSWQGGRGGEEIGV